jgi:hypothetical protein
MTGEAKVDRLTVLEASVAALETENAQLRGALSSRVVIEQAKGVLIERFTLTVEAAFELLRSSARRSRRNLHEVAAEVVRRRQNPDAIEKQIRARPPGKGSADDRRGPDAKAGH